MEARPRINIQLTKLDKVTELASIALLMILWLFTIYALLSLPAIIPVHFNASGKADSEGNKETLLLLPLLATFIYTGLTWLSKYPYLFNYIPKITEENAAQQYGLATRMLRFLKASVLLIFVLIIVLSYTTIIGFTKGLGGWFLPLILVLILAPTIFFVSRSISRKK